MDIFERAAATIMALMIAVIIWALIYSFGEADRHEEDRLVCESKGGIQLERTYSQGRTTGHSYTCISKEVVL